VGPWHRQQTLPAHRAGFTVGRTRAPAGRFNALPRRVHLPWRNFTEREWLKMKREIVTRMMKEWQRYAPNVTMDNFIEAYITTPDDVVNRNPCMPQGGWGGLDSDLSHLGRCVVRGDFQLPDAGTELLSLFLSGAFSARYRPRVRLQLLQDHSPGPQSYRINRGKEEAF